MNEEEQDVVQDAGEVEGDDDEQNLAAVEDDGKLARNRRAGLIRKLMHTTKRAPDVIDAQKKNKRTSPKYGNRRRQPVENAFMLIDKMTTSNPPRLLPPLQRRNATEYLRSAAPLPSLGVSSFVAAPTRRFLENRRENSQNCPPQQRQLPAVANAEFPMPAVHALYWSILAENKDNWSPNDIKGMRSEAKGMGKRRSQALYEWIYSHLTDVQRAGRHNNVGKRGVLQGTIRGHLVISRKKYNKPGELRGLVEFLFRDATTEESSVSRRIQQQMEATEDSVVDAAEPERAAQQEQRNRMNLARWRIQKPHVQKTGFRHMLMRVQADCGDDAWTLFRWVANEVGQATDSQFYSPYETEVVPDALALPKRVRFLVNGDHPDAQSVMYLQNRLALMSDARLERLLYGEQFGIDFDYKDPIQHAPYEYVWGYHLAKGKQNELARLPSRSEPQRVAAQVRFLVAFVRSKTGKPGDESKQVAENTDYYAVLLRRNTVASLRPGSTSEQGTPWQAPENYTWRYSCAPLSEHLDNEFKFSPLSDNRSKDYPNFILERDDQHVQRLQSPLAKPADSHIGYWHLGDLPSFDSAEKKSQENKGEDEQEEQEDDEKGRKRKRRNATTLQTKTNTIRSEMDGRPIIPQREYTPWPEIVFTHQFCDMADNALLPHRFVDQTSTGDPSFRPVRQNNDHEVYHVLPVDMTDTNVPHVGKKRDIKVHNARSLFEVQLATSRVLNMLHRFELALTTVQLPDYLKAEMPTNQGNLLSLATHNHDRILNILVEDLKQNRNERLLLSDNDAKGTVESWLQSYKLRLSDFDRRHAVQSDVPEANEILRDAARIVSETRDQWLRNQILNANDIVVDDGSEQPVGSQIITQLNEARDRDQPPIPDNSEWRDMARQIYADRGKYAAVPLPALPSRSMFRRPSRAGPLSKRVENDAKARAQAQAEAQAEEAEAERYLAELEAYQQDIENESRAQAEAQAHEEASMEDAYEQARAQAQAEAEAEANAQAEAQGYADEIKAYEDELAELQQPEPLRRPSPLRSMRRSPRLDAALSPSRRSPQISPRQFQSQQTAPAGRPRPPKTLRRILRTEK